MEPYTPEPPVAKLSQLQNDDPESYDFVMMLLWNAAKTSYKEDPEIEELGLEATLETYISLFDKGFIKFAYDDNEEVVRINVFNPLTGKYRYES